MTSPFPWAKSFSGLFKSLSSSPSAKKAKRRRQASRPFPIENLEQRLLLTVLEDFDSLTVPSLPGGWTTSATGSFPQAWVTVSGGSDSAPNHLFIADVEHTPGASFDNVYDSQITSPNVAITANNSRLTFRHSYDLDADASQFFDGGVLEIAIDGGNFSDILDAGGTFVTGGYIGPISSGGNTPLPDRLAWGGNSNGYITTTVDLPAAAIGHDVQFRWRLATDNIMGATGWSIDSIKLVYPDPDDQISEATVVTLGNTVTGSISDPPDVDLYAFDVVFDGQTIAFDLDFAAAAGMNDSFLRLFDQSGNQIAANDDGNAPGESALPARESFLRQTFAVAGRYYIGVSAFDNETYNPTTGEGDSVGSNTGGYTLRIDPIPTAIIDLSTDTLGVGDTMSVHIFFSEAVTGFSNSDLTVPNGTLSTVSSSDGGVTWTATYTPDPEVIDDTNVISLDNTGYTDTTSNPGAGTASSVNFTINTHIEISPVLENTGGAATFIASRRQPVNVFSAVIVDEGDSTPNIPGGTLTISVNVVGNKKGSKLFDIFTLPSTNGIGTGTPQIVGGTLTLTLQLANNVTTSALQAFLQGITFSTSGAGLRTLTRTVTVTLTDTAGKSKSITQTINVRKR